MASPPEMTTPMTIFEITEQISMLNLNESSSSLSTSTSMDELISISTDDVISLIAPTTQEPQVPPERKLSVAYTVSEAIVSLLAIFGNALVVYIFCKNRSLRRYRNYYIVALAIADFLVGLLGIPFAILASVGLPRNLYGCLFTVSILMVLCTVSILCLVAVSIDRYWATTNPFAYYRNMTTTTAVSIILFCWVAGAIIGFLPLFGWYNREGWERDPPEYCFFTDVMDYSYLVFLYFATIVFPALLMIGFYGYIYHVVLIKIRQKGTFAPQHLRRFSEQSRTGSISCENRSATQVLRIMVSEKRREAKAAKKLGIIVLFFMLCWMPLYTINCIQAFYPKFHVPIEFLNFTIILSHANSALNPFLYAYHLKEFRLAMKNALLALIGKLCCGLVNTHVDKENPLGPMSRSLTMPSLGHVTTIPNNNAHSGKVSIKFRKIGRADAADCRSAQISPTSTSTTHHHHHHLQQHNNKNLSSVMMIPMVVNGTPSRDNLLRTAGGTDKSLTSLSLASDSSQLPAIPLEQITSTSTPVNGGSSMKSSPKINGGNKTQKYNNIASAPTLLSNHVSMPQLSMSSTVAVTTDQRYVSFRSGKYNHGGENDTTTQCNSKCIMMKTMKTAPLSKSESLSSLSHQELIDECTPKATSPFAGDNNSANEGGTLPVEGSFDGDVDKNATSRETSIEIPFVDSIDATGEDEKRHASCEHLNSPPAPSPPPSPAAVQDNNESQMNSHSVHSNNNKEECGEYPIESSHKSASEKIIMISQQVISPLPPSPKYSPEEEAEQQQQPKSNFDAKIPPESHRVSLDG